MNSIDTTYLLENHPSSNLHSQSCVEENYLPILDSLKEIFTRYTEVKTEWNDHLSLRLFAWWQKTSPIKNQTNINPHQLNQEIAKHIDKLINKILVDPLSPGQITLGNPVTDGKWAWEDETLQEYLEIGNKYPIEFQTARLTPQTTLKPHKFAKEILTQVNSANLPIALNLSDELVLANQTNSNNALSLLDMFIVNLTKSDIANENVRFMKLYFYKYKASQFVSSEMSWQLLQSIKMAEQEFRELKIELDQTSKQQIKQSEQQIALQQQKRYDQIDRSEQLHQIAVDSQLQQIEEKEAQIKIETEKAKTLEQKKLAAQKDFDNLFQAYTKLYQ